MFPLEIHLKKSFNKILGWFGYVDFSVKLWVIFWQLSVGLSPFPVSCQFRIFCFFWSQPYLLGTITYPVYPLPFGYFWVDDFPAFPFGGISFLVPTEGKTSFKQLLLWRETTQIINGLNWCLQDVWSRNHTWMFPKIGVPQMDGL